MEPKPPPTRLKSLLLLPVGVANLSVTLHTLRADRTYHPKLTGLGIVLALLSVVGVIEPRLLDPWHEAFARDPQISSLKGAAALVYVVIFGVALYPVIALSQGWWLPEPLLAAIRR